MTVPATTWRQKIYRNLYKSSARSQKHRQRTVDVSTYSKVGIKAAHTLLTQGSAGPSTLNDPVPRNSTSFASALDEFLHCPLNPKNGEQVVCTFCTSLKSNLFFWDDLLISCGEVNWIRRWAALVSGVTLRIQYHALAPSHQAHLGSQHLE